MLYAPAAKVKTPDKNEYEFSAEEADTLPFDGETVVLDDLVRDEILLEIERVASTALVEVLEGEEP